MDIGCYASFVFAGLLFLHTVGIYIPAAVLYIIQLTLKSDTFYANHAKQRLIFAFILTEIIAIVVMTVWYFIDGSSCGSV